MKFIQKENFEILSNAPLIKSKPFKQFELIGLVSWSDSNESA